MKIVCSLKPGQIKGLYNDIYKDLKKMSSKKELDVDSYLTNLFDEIEKIADTSTAVKFIQAAPLLMYTASTKIPNFATDVNFDPSKLLELHKKFSSPDVGLQYALSYFRFMESPSVLRESIYETQLSVNIIPVTDENSSKRSFPFRSILNIFSTVSNQFYVGDASHKEWVEKNQLVPKGYDDQGFIFTLLNKLIKSDLKTGLQIQYQNHNLNLVPVPLNKISKNVMYDFDKRWIKNQTFSRKADKHDTKFMDTKDIIVMVVSDEKGNPLLFDEIGNISSTGKVVYQEMRPVIEKNGEYVLINRMGEALFNNNTYKEFAKVQNISEKESKEQLQKELKAIYDLRQKVLKGQRPVLAMTGIHAGQPRYFNKKDLSLANLSELEFVDEQTFETIETIKTGDSQFSQGVSVITLLGDRYQLSRPIITEELIDKISDVLLNDKLNYELRKQFLQTLLPVKIGDSQARHKILYLNQNKKIVFQYFDKTQLEGLGTEKTLTLTEDNADQAKAIIKDVLMRGRVSENTMVPVKLNYSSKGLKYNQYLDYVDGKLVNADKTYIEFLKGLEGTGILATTSLDDRVNQAMFYAPESSVVQELIDSTKNHNTASLVRQAKDALVKLIKEKGPFKTTITRINKGIDSNGKPYGLFEFKSPVGLVDIIKIGMTNELKVQDIADTIIKEGDEIVILVQDTTTEDNTGVFPDTAVAYWQGQKIGNVRETDFNIGETARKSIPKGKTNQEKATEIIKSKDQGNSTEDDGGVSGKFFHRSKILSKDKGTQVQNDKATKWFKNHEISKHLDLRRAINIVNSNAYADFMTYGAVLGGKYGVITLFDDASNMDIYHEAWHGFTQLFLTQSQKEALYNEVRKRLKGAENLSYEEIEEILAEDFRTYAKNPKSIKGAPKRNSIFRQILKALNWFFGTNFGKTNIVTNVLEIENVKQFYENLYYNKDLNNYTPSLNNVRFNYLRRSSGLMNGLKEQVLDRQDARKISKSLDSILSKTIDKVAEERNFDKSFALKMVLDDRNKKVFYEEAYTKLTEAKDAKYKELEKFNESPKDNSFEIENVKNNIRILETALDNFGNANYGTIAFHLENSDFAILNSKNLSDIRKQIELDAESEAEENIEELEQFRRDDVGKKSLLEVAGKETIFALKSLFEVDENGNYVLDDFGFEELADFRTTWNNTARAIAGIQDPQEMYDKLVNASELYPPFKQLIKYKLPNPKTANIGNGNTPFFNNKIVGSLWQAFSKTRVPYLQYSVFGVKGSVTNASIQQTKILREFRTKFKNTESNYILRDPDTNSPKLNLARIITDFSDAKGNLDSSKYLEFARAIGIFLDNSATIRDELSKNESAKSTYGLPYMFNFLKIINGVQEQTNNSEETLKDLNEFLLEPLRGFYRGIPTTILPAKEPIKQSSQLKALSTLQGRFGDVANIFGVISAEGNLVYEFINNNSISKQIYGFNTAKKLSDLWTSEGYMSYINPAVNTFTRNSSIIRSLFHGENQNFKRRKGTDILFFINSGTRSTDVGVSTTSLDYYGKLLQESNTMVSYGMQEFMRTSNKKSSFGAKVNGGIRSANRFEELPVPIDSYLYVPLKMVAQNNYRDHLYTNFALPYLASELDRVHKFKSNPEIFKTYAGYNRLLSDNKTYAGEVLTAFSDILTENTQKQLYKYVQDFINDNESFDALAFLTDVSAFVAEDQVEEAQEMVDAIENEINNYFNALSKETLEEFEEVPFISDDILENLSALKVEEKDYNKVFIKTYSINAFIHNFETANLFLGDIVQFNHPKEDLWKRNSGATSVAPSFRTDQTFKDYVGGWVKSTSYAAQTTNTDGTVRKFLDYSKGTFETAVFNDPVRVSKSIDLIESALRKKYTSELGRSIKYSKKTALKAEVDKRIDRDLKQYSEMEEADGQGFITFDAYRVLKIAEDAWSISQEDLFQKIVRGEELTADEIAEFLPVYKIFNFGFLKGTIAPVSAMHKFALVPLIPSVYKNTDYEKLHEQMMANNIQYITFKSGSKLGSISKVGEKADNPFEDDEQLIISENIEFTKNTIYLEYLKNVTEIPKQFKGQSIISTQGRKLVIKGLFNQGKIIDPKYQSYVDNYDKAIEELTNIKKIELLTEINWTIKDGKYVGKIGNFLDLVVKELGRKGLPEHQINYIQAARDGNIREDLSFHLEADTIEKMILSIIEKRLITQKANGESLIQMSSVFSKGIITGLNEDQESDVNFTGSNNFPFFTINKDGTTNGFKVGIAMQNDYKYLLNLDDPAGLTDPIYKASFAQLESIEGDDKLFILESDLTDELREQLVIDDKGGTRVKGQKYEGIDILGDFYSHKTLKSRDNDALDIIVVKSKDMASAQVKAYKEGGAKQFTKLQRGENIRQHIGNVKRLNELLKDNAWLDANNKVNRRKITIVGTRIPGQSHGSLPFMEIYEFLDPAFASTIILPAEFLVISGSDLDIDSLKSLFKNLTSKGNQIGQRVKSGPMQAQVTKVTRSKISKNNQMLLFPETVTESLEKLLEDTDEKYLKSILDYRRKIAENNLMDSIIDILSLPINFANLVRPNSTFLLKDQLADKLAPHVSDHNRFKSKTRKGTHTEIFPTRTLEPIANHQKHKSFLGSSKVLGIGAIENALNSIFNSIGAAMPLTHKNQIFDDDLDRYIDGTEDYDIRLFLPHNLTDDLKISLSDIYSVEGEDIGELYNQLVNGLVDTPTDDWIYYLQANPETIPVTAYLLKAGVPLDYIGYFVSNPFVREYTKQQRIMKGAYADVLDMVPRINGVKKRQLIQYQAAVNTIEKLAPTYFKAFMKSKALSNKNYYNSINRYILDKGILDKENHFKLNDLVKIVESEDITDNYKAATAFLHFLEIQKQIKGVTALKLNSNRDTTRSKSLAELLLREASFDQLHENTKLDKGLAKRMKEDSILSSFFIQDLIEALVVPAFEFRNQPLINKFILTNIIDYTAGMNRDEISSFLTRFKNGVQDAVYQNVINQFSEQEISLPYTDKKLLMNYDNVMGVTEDSFSEAFINIIFSLPADVKNRFPILGQFELLTKTRQLSLKETERRKKFLTVEEREASKRSESLSILSLINIDEVKRNSDLADRYNKDLLELADPNVTKLNNKEDNIKLSNLFGMLPLVSVLQTGVGSYNVSSMSSVMPQTIYTKIMSNAGVQWSNENLDNKLLKRVAYKNISGDFFIDYLGTEVVPIIIQPEEVQLELFEKPTPVAQFPQQFISGISRQEAKPEIKQALGKTNPTSMEMVLAGFRTRTTRTQAFLDLNPVQVGDVIENYGIVEDGSTKRALAVVIAIHPKGTEEYISTWNQEGWTESGVEKIKEIKGGAAAIIFKTIGIDEVLKNKDVVGEKIINDTDINSFKKYVKKAKAYPEEFFTSSTKFEVFYNTNTGRRDGAPQESIWIRQSNGRYDLIDVMTGEEYIRNVDLETGIQYLSPSQVQVETPTQTKQENNTAVDVIDEFINDRSYTISLSDPATTMTIVPEYTITRMQLERLRGSSLIGIGLNLTNNDKIINEEGRLLGLASTYNLDKTVSQTQTTLSQFVDQVGLGSAFAGTYSALKYLQSKGVDKITYDANGMLTNKMFDELNKIRQNMPEGTPLQKMSMKDHSNMIKNVEGYRNTAVGKYFQATVDVLKKSMECK